jgi:hypothetical protein
MERLMRSGWSASKWNSDRVLHLGKFVTDGGRSRENDFRAAL